jgi:membrane-bound metal-dependent hydrolase YbcI (DUF457 family)
MYAGHFAVGLALKANRPAAPTWALLLGTGFLDVLFGIFVMLGIERVTMTTHVGQGFSLDFIDWSHSLLMSLVWSLAYGAFFWRRGRLIALLLAFAVFSHFLLDLPMHPKDLALWPQSAIHVGFGLWNRLPIGWWWIELVIVLAACAYYAARARRLKTFGGHVLWASAVILLLHVLNAPWWKH